jgi:IclR family acetate operon transcriptional repressor
MTISALSKILGVNKSTAFRLLTTLKSRGFVINPPNSKAFLLGSAIIRLAEKTEWISTLIQISSEYLHNLTALTGETTHLAVLEGNHALIIADEMSPKSIGVTIGKGATGLLHCTSVGKALILDSDKEELKRLLGPMALPSFTQNTIVDMDVLFESLVSQRKLGYAVDDEEHILGIRCIGVPIRDIAGQIVASLGLSAPVQRLPNSSYAEVGRQVMEVGEAISEKLGVRPLFTGNKAAK